MTELSTPPSTRVRWWAYARTAHRMGIVRAKTWFLARARAAVRFGVAPEDLEIRSLETMTPVDKWRESVRHGVTRLA